VAILHAGHFTRADLEQVIRLIAKGTIRVRPLIKDLVPVTQAQRIYDTLRDRPNELGGTVFRW
jgi:threonine dehydrogenase-like Zn-dependent dehydrogenase